MLPIEKVLLRSKMLNFSIYDRLNKGCPGNARNCLGESRTKVVKHTRAIGKELEKENLEYYKRSELTDQRVQTFGVESLKYNFKRVKSVRRWRVCLIQDTMRR